MQVLAIAYLRVRRYDQGLELSEQTLALQRSQLGPRHPETLRSMNNLAASYLAVGRYAAALKLFNEALVGQREKLGTEHPDTLMTLRNLALTYKKCGRHEEAESAYAEAFVHYCRSLGPEHDVTRETMASLVETCTALEHFQKIADLYREHVRIIEQQAAHDPALESWLAPRYNNLAWLLATCDDPKVRAADEAVVWAKKAVTVVAGARSILEYIGSGPIPCRCLGGVAGGAEQVDRTPVGWRRERFLLCSHGQLAARQPERSPAVV